MSNRDSSVIRSVFAALIAAALVLVPATSALAQRSIDEADAPDGASTEDDPASLETGDENDFPASRAYARSNYVWPYSRGPAYPAIDVYQQGVVWTPAGVFQLQSELGIPAELRTENKLAAQARQYFVVQYHDDLAAEVEGDLAKIIALNGGQVIASPNSGSLIARLNQDAYDAVRVAVGILAVEPYHAAFKLDPKIGRTPLPDPIRALSDVYTLVVRLWPREDPIAAAEAVTNIGGTVSRTYGDSLVVELHRSLLPQLAAIDAVRAVHEFVPYRPLGEETTVNVQTGRFENGGENPYHDAGVTGGGLNLCSGDLATPCTVATQDTDCSVAGGTCLGPQVLMVLDSGIQLDAGDLSDTKVDGGTPGLAHRKVREYASTYLFGGQGDLKGCDAPPQGGYTHGHVVSAVALGNGTNVGTDYGAIGWVAIDAHGNPWTLDGVAPGAVLVGYDGQITPPNGSCSDPLMDSIKPGDLYNPIAPPTGICPGLLCPGALGKAHADHGAKVVNLSWGSLENTYTAEAEDIDAFMADKRDALVFVAAGNQGADAVPQGGDGIPDAETLGAPATTKNGLAIGASRNARFDEIRAGFTSTGPAVDTTTNRIAPQLMAPGGDYTTSYSINSEFGCRTSDNDQSNPVECDIMSGLGSTSYATAAASGAALLVRDYFRQGYHPDTVQTPSDSVEIGAALVKAILVASANFMSGSYGAHRWNNYQGYGRIQLDDVLPLENWQRSPTGLLIHDPFSGRTDLGLPFTISTGQTHSTTFKVTNNYETLRIALAWIDPASGTPALRNDLNLTVISPSGIEYRGNYFTDDNDQDGVPETGEDCGGIGAADPDVGNGSIDSSQWSLPVCSKTAVLGKAMSLRAFDNSNPTEAIFLSPLGGESDAGTCTPTSTANANGPCSDNLDCRATIPGSMGDGECDNPGLYRQTEIGEWTLIVSAAGSLSGDQEFAVAVAGGAALGSAAWFTSVNYRCNSAASIAVADVLEIGTYGTDNPSEADISDRITVNVIDGDPDSPDFGNVVDTETGLSFTQYPPGLLFQSDPIRLTDGTARDPGNGALDVRDRDQLRVVYTDADVDAPGMPLTVLRRNGSNVNCEVDILYGNVTFNQFGQDSTTLVQGGCERNVRDEFYFGFPDRYMDAGESLIFNFAFASNEIGSLRHVVADLSCVNIDDDSPVGCLPTGAGCDPSLPPPEGCGGPCDPRRENNTPCEWMSILDTPKDIGWVPSDAALSANFSIQMAGDGPGEPFEDIGGGQPTPTVEMLLELTAPVSGQAHSALAVSRQRLNVDTVTTWYSTDYPSGGTEVVDHGPGQTGNNDEIASNPISENANWQTNDYRFETFVFAPLNTGGVNQNLMSPWDFDANDGGFTNGLASVADETAADIFNIHNWGEDKNFNGIEDGVCVSAPGIACYNFSGDVRCTAAAGDPTCISVENNGGGTSFVNNWNTKGGCGWQTRAPGECTGDTTRGCYVDDDCKGTCQVDNNEIASTFDPCNTSVDCPFASACGANADFPLAPCTTDDDCGDGGPDDVCDHFVFQQCVGAAGTCGSVVGDHTGGVWHTGEIGDVGAICDGSQGSACANYKVIAGSGGNLIWWELLVTPVMEKLNQTIGPDGLPEATIEIFDWGWNANVNNRDQFALWTWEFDTDLARLFPVDLFIDGSILNSGDGPYGAVDEGSNPDLTNGWPIFAPQCECTTAPFGTCVTLTECSPGACAVSGNTCHVDAECDPGQCSITPQDCFSNDDCPAGICDAGALGEPCHTDADCQLIDPLSVCTGAPETCDDPLPEGCAGAPQCDCSGGASVNGNLGGSRVGSAGCFFEGAIASDAYRDLGTALPRDDDIDNDLDGREDGTAGAYDCNDGIDNDSDGFCDLPTSTCTDSSTPGDPECELWIDGNNEPHGLDEFVQVDGPYRNQDITSFNGPDMRRAILEDIYGDTGNTFQGAIGFAVFEGTPESQAQQSYGIAVDDMVVKWREFEFESDITDCAVSGSCAVVELDRANVFTGEGVRTITVLESTPDPANDCDLDGVPDATNDCNGNGTPDVVVRATSDAEIVGEIVVLDNVGGNEYKGTLALSSLSDSPGVLFIARVGADNPTVTVSYLDNDIDPGPAIEPCPNDVDPNKWGLVQSFTTIFLRYICEVTVVSVELTDNGDGDLFVDTEETVDMRVCLVNNCGRALHDCTGRLFSNSPEVDCVLDPTIDIGDLADTEEIVCTTDAFKWKMADVSRSDVNDILEATFQFTMTCDEIEALSVGQSFNMSLDLDLDDQGQTPQVWLEGFEGGDLASSKFYAENLDAGIPGANNIEGQFNGDGWRCQYHDPDWVNSNTYGNDIALDCYPGATLDQSNAIFWQVDGIDTGSPDGGRAKTGNYSMYYGVYLTDPAGNFTTPLATVESVATRTPINLGVGNPEMSFWHQINLVDWTNLNTNFMTNADRGVMQYKTVDLAGDDTSVWMTLQPFQNAYDEQAYSNYYNCFFDPVDDGTTEDDFFDPTDPDRRLGPSSTCWPMFSYGCQGDTDDPFQVGNICNASTQPSPADQGALGTGTWVQTKIDLSSLRGRRIHMRFLVSAIKGTAETFEEQFANNPSPEDDGWWIDDVTVDETLSNPALLLVDTNVVQHCAGDPAMGCLTDQDCIDAGTTGPCEGEAPQCGAICTGVTAQVTTYPDNTGGTLDEVLTAPGQAIYIYASDSFGTCLDGALQFRFSKDNGATVLREFSEASLYTDAPLVDTDYLIEVRCSTDISCTDSVTLDVDVDCPSSGNLGDIFPMISAMDKTTWAWTPAKDYMLWQGDLHLVNSYAGTDSTGSGSSFTHVPTPSVGFGYYYLVREMGEYCNENGPWTSDGAGEQPGRDTTLP